MKIPNKKITEMTQVVPLDQCLAKSRKMGDNNIVAGRNVFNHCQIVGEVARALILRMPIWLRLALFPDGSELIAAAHDIGKVSPTFQKKIYALLSFLSQNEDAVLALLKNEDPTLEKLWGGHAGVSQSSVSVEKPGLYIAEILGQHHGFAPNLSTYQATSEVFGGAEWHTLRLELLSQLKTALVTDFPVVKDALQAKVLAGLTTVSDWIGSGALFEDPEGDWKSSIDMALNEAGFVAPQIRANLSFQDIFGFEPKNTQLKLIEAVNQPGVYVLEAPMGLGKTEAALYAAYKLLEKNSATGIYFALPTQLTSEKIHERVNQFLEKILDESSAQTQSLLVHSNAWLKMGEEGNPGGSWFAQGKRGILAPFAVGTVDQALMAVMNVKHGFVRTFGLAGKVVILDEVHSYDSFTGTILDALINALRQLECTVIILSATLTQERREKLLGLSAPCNASHKPYPLITAQPNHAPLAEIETAEIPDVTVHIGHATDLAAIEEALLRAEQGQQVLWIENTVNEAQSVFQLLAARSTGLGIACGLLHSRFIKKDRASNEDVWVRIFGKDGAKERAAQGRILVGTQVLEQSLDIDADFLVSRIAPTDMLLQRLGRLWRHSETIRPALAKREAWILAPDLATAIISPESSFGTTAKVYSSYVLCRSLAVWENIVGVCLPSQIRELIEATYVAQVECAEMAGHLQQLKMTREKLEGLALVGLSKAVKTQAEEKAQTRHSELETTDVLLVRSIQVAPQGVYVILLNREKLWLPHNGRSLGRKKWHELTSTLMQNTLKVADYLAPIAIDRKHLLWLGDYFYLGKPEYDESNQLRVALVDESGFIRAFQSSVANEKYVLTYDERIGYQNTKKVTKYAQ
ncbi:MAG: CRISPR-associated helicase Cas3' [Polynucleobacter sp.]|uniref:CRISPR-associated helicase Cas3' n=1 Tax=Polynucleobacter sp. TaxID=2029855 RepID=UPI002725D2EF|nr:CRISPR-associated helicase Cas3' [Polynucleobacter sp.]MDO8714006.1 CRISPR-associated helicase Cas3' [Polynucleobacter sp.]